jgi:O-antigen/teichoic acid export membrane protein
MRVLLHRFTVLAVTAFPGVQRVVVFALVARVSGMAALGRFSSDISVVSLIGFFTAVGWSSVILVRVPKAPDQEALAVTTEISALALLSLVVGCAVLTVLRTWGLVFHLFDSCAYLSAWTGYQLVRHYFIAAQRYYRLLLAEVLILASVCVLLAVFPASSEVIPYRALSIPLGTLVVGSASCLWWRAWRKGVWPLRIGAGTVVTGLEFGANNMISGGMAMIIPPLVVRVAGAGYGGLLGLISSLLGIVGLVPRAMALQKLPDLARALVAGNRDHIARLLSRFQTQLNAALGIFSLAAIICWLPIYTWTVRSQIEFKESSLIFFLMLLALVAGQLTLPHANYLMAAEKSKALLRVNAIASCLFLVVIPVVWFGGFSPAAAVYSIVSWQSVTFAVKSVMTYRCHAEFFYAAPSV